MIFSLSLFSSLKSIRSTAFSRKNPDIFSKNVRNMSEKRKILVTCKIPKVGMEILKKELGRDEFLIEEWPHEETLSNEELKGKVNGMEGILCILQNQIKGETLQNAKDLKVISTMSVGYDHIDVEECFKRNILVGNTPGVLTETTADLALTLILTTCRRIPEAVNAVRSGEWGTWKPEWMCGRDLHHSTVGIFGFGRIGQAVAKRLLGFGCNVIYSSREEKKDLPKELLVGGRDGNGVKFVDFETLLKESDIVVPQCPLNDQTRKIFNLDTFKKMKRDSIFINTTRGEVVDQEGLYVALKEGLIHSAGIDVTTPEPIPLDHKLLTLPNLVVLPHVGSATMETRGKMAEIAARNLVAGLKGLPLLHQIKPKK
eukprot:TRINITY_DN11268_c0_g1_i1.p1 TRINITY_DN11268_c0_g1~~TRINITY_DN11268_c0_g1_i1.p1  ORF type:complete len:371 (+),score=141.23 TRINITY_DN11268_c0_g1_i1:38-1150(+)